MTADGYGLQPRQSDETRRAFGLTAVTDAAWGQFVAKQVAALADDVRSAPNPDYELVRLGWLRNAFRENSRLTELAELVGYTADDLAHGTPLAPGSIHGLRSLATHQTLLSAANRDYRDRQPSPAEQLNENLAMFSARIWTRAPAYFLTAADIDPTTPQPAARAELPNPTILVFHDTPLPFAVPAHNGMTHVVAWVFAANDGQLLNVCQVLTIGADGTDFIKQNATLDCPALAPLSSAILELIATRHWRPRKRQHLRGNPTTMDRTWRRDLTRHRDYEYATGSLDAVRLSTEHD